jgi:hypothetical protein
MDSAPLEGAMAMRLVVSLGQITLQKLQEDPEDEVYVLGGVRVFKPDRTPVPAKSAVFASSNVMIFKKTDVGITRQLNPGGDVYDDILDDDEYAKLHIFVVEHDAASTVQDITGELRNFINGINVPALVDKGTVEMATELAQLLLDFINTMGNIFDDDDIIGEFRKTYRMNGLRAVMTAANMVFMSEPFAIPTVMDNALYKPVTGITTIARL